MFKFLKQSPATKEVAIAETKGKTTKQIVEEIHETFYTEVDRLLADAKVMKSTETQYQTLIDKAAKLKALGFSGTRECAVAESEIARLNEIEQKNSEKNSLKDAIEYFSQKYPLYKFITEDSVKKICAKYGLVYGDVSRYKGTVPDKNLNEMERFKIQETDECWVTMVNRVSVDSTYMNRTYRRVPIQYQAPPVKDTEPVLATYIDRDEWQANIAHRIMMNQLRYNIDNNEPFPEKCPLEIAAPKCDFSMKGMEVVDGKLTEKAIEIPDPVVLQPVHFRGKKHYLIVSAWGLEASDELVVNEKMN